MDAPVREGPAPAGDNLPPAMRAYEAHKANIEDLYAEAKNWLDGEPITTPEQAEKVELLLEMIREAQAAADESRKAEAKPHDEAKAEIQARYNPLIGETKATGKGKAVLAREACIAALTPWRRKLDEERQAAAEAARRAAEEAAAKAAEAARAAGDNLEAKEQAEALVADARAAETAAKKAAAPQATGLRTYWRAQLTDATEAARHYWPLRPGEFAAFLQKLAEEDVSAGKRQIPGFQITEEKRAV